jgi:2,4-diketo-3-deoxy-L-fuconate hydrolase
LFQAKNKHSNFKDMTKIILALFAGILLVLLNVYPAHTQLIPSIKIAGNKKNPQIIKAPEEALSFSRYSKNGQIHTLAVLEDNGDSLTGVDISSELKRYEQNSFDVIRNMTYNEVVQIIRRSSKKIVLKYTDLLPCVEGDKHLAIGINYAEHGKETGQVKPFMFPKLVKTDPAAHQLNYHQDWLLDHEVELGVVFPAPVCRVADLNRMMIGFLVVNDYTDRATLMHKMDSQNVTGGRGFPDAKSKKGFLPTGPYMVIPKDRRAFVRELQLKLSVNGVLRQQGHAKDMVWDIDKIVENSLAVRGRKMSFYQNKMVKLFEDNCIPANSIIITGTPSGVVFNAPSKAFIFGAVTKYLWTGSIFKHQMHPYILKQYLRKEMTNPRYLKPGDDVETSISYLGTINTSIKGSTPKLGCR